MTPKQEAFVREYLIDLNGAGAARRAGYKAKNADVLAGQLLGKTCVKEAIQKAKAEREERTKINADYVLKGAAALFERCMQRVPVMVFDRENKCMVQVTEEVLDRNTGELREEGVWKFDSTGAAAALNILGKHVDIQAFKEKHEIEHKGGVTMHLPDQFQTAEEWEAGNED